MNWFQKKLLFLKIYADLKLYFKLSPILKKKTEKETKKTLRVALSHLAEISKAFSEKGVVCLAAYVAPYPVYTPFSISGALTDVQVAMNCWTVHWVQAG